MARTFASPRHTALVEFLRKKREEKKGLTQAKAAKRPGRYQSYVTDYERGQKRIDAAEPVNIAEAIGFDPLEAIRVIQRAKSLYTITRCELLRRRPISRRHVNIEARTRQ